MKNRLAIGVLVFFLLLSFGLSLAAAPLLPDRVASHWDENGIANGFQPKMAFLLTLPLISLGVALLLFFLPFMDPLKENLQNIRPFYNWFIAGVLLFMDYIHFLSILYNLGFKINLFAFMLPAFALLMIGIGFFLERVKTNWFIGIRTPWTMSSPTIWEKTHRLGATLFKWGGLIVLAGFFIPQYAVWFLMVPLLGVAFFLVLYSYLLFRNEQKTH